MGFPLYGKEGFKMRKNKLFIIKLDERIIAISENMESIALYINQFAHYFRNHYEYEISTISETDNPKQFNFISSSYSDLYLHPFTKNTVLTQKELLFYGEIFHELYENTKNMMSQCIKNCKLFDLSIEEKKMNMDLFDSMYKKIYSYQSFLNTLDESYIFEKYIVNPGLIDTMEIKNNQNNSNI